MTEGDRIDTATIEPLDDRTIQRIAAGEVVERPASVVKELIENSIDAGADRIDIVVEGRDGTERIVVDDDGHGIPEDAIERALEPHTTSKIGSLSDLSSGPGTLGFRGEALHAIGNVARLTVSSRHEDDEIGAEVVMDAGEVVDRRRAGVPSGTRVVVEDLFEPVPARKKFLDTPETERSRIRRLVADLALANPDVAVSLTVNGRDIFEVPGDGSIQSAVGAVHGRSVAEAMVPIEPNGTGDAIEHIDGFVSDPDTSRSTSAYVTAVINGRPVQSPALRRAIVAGYDDRLAPDRYPFAVVHLVVDPTTVDVNVHPRKLEVEFDDEAAVTDAVTDAVAEAIDAHASVPAETSRAPVRSDADRQSPRPAIDLGAVSSGGSQATLPGTETTAERTGFERLPSLRIVGQAHDAFIVGETDDGIVLIDQHAADERIHYERLRADVRGTNQYQQLASPVAVDLTPEEVDALVTHREAIESMGFRCSVRDLGETRITAVPSVLGQALPPEALTEALHTLLDGALQSDTDATVPELADPMLADLACHPAITANTSLTDGSIETLVRALDRCNAPWTCPHGRPTIIEITGEELAERFERDYPGARPCRDWDAVEADAR